MSRIALRTRKDARNYDRCFEKGISLGRKESRKEFSRPFAEQRDCD